MKKTLIALSVGLGLASSAVFANTGSIHFYGQVQAGTCPIVIIDPENGAPMPRVGLGNVNAAEFTSAGSEAGNRSFGMRIDPNEPGCNVLPGTVAQVQFTGAYGGAGAASKLYALQPSGAGGLALAIKDDTGTLVEHTGTSKAYKLSETMPTDMIFTAVYQSTDASVTPGPANSDVRFVVDIH